MVKNSTGFYDILIKLVKVVDDKIISPKALVLPILKNGESMKIGNYRPSISVLSEVIEKNR